MEDSSFVSGDWQPDSDIIEGAGEEALVNSES